MTAEFMTERSPSLTATTPAAFIAPISANASPLPPCVIPPSGNTRQYCWRAARSTTKLVTVAESLNGRVWGSAQTAVKPPAAGAKAYTGVVSAEGDYFVIEISEVRGGDLGALADAAGEVLRQQAGQQLASAQMRKLTDSLRERTSVKLLPIPE